MVSIDKAHDEQEKLIQKGINLLLEQPANLQDMIKIMNRLNYLKGVLSSQIKKDEDFISGNHLCTRSKLGEDNKRENMPNDTDNKSAKRMICCCCGKEDESHSAYCFNCGRVPHEMRGKNDKVHYL